MFGKFTEEAQKVLTIAKEEMSELNHPYVGSEHLMLALLKQNNELTKKLQKFGLTYKNFKQELINIVGVGTINSKWFLYTPMLRKIIECAVKDSKENDSLITSENLLLSLLINGDGIANSIIIKLNINTNKLIEELSNKTTKKEFRKSILKNLATDLSKFTFDPVIGRDEELERLIEILCRRNKCNPILIGNAGVGKTALVEELSRLIKIGRVPNLLKNKKIFSLDMAGAVAGTKYRGEFEDRIKKLINELENNDNVILFIDEIHTLVGAGGAEGAIDASNIFKPALARGKIKIIGATTIDEYKKFIEKDSALDRRFQKIFLEEPNKENLRNILLNLKTIYEKYHKVSISDEMIEKIIELSKKYIYDRYEPDKSIDILDEVCTKVSLKISTNEKKIINYEKELEEITKLKNNNLAESNFELAYKNKDKENELIEKIENIKSTLNSNKIKKVTINDIFEVISKKAKIPIYELNNDYNKHMAVISNNLKEKIIGQDFAIEQLLKVTKKIKLGLKDKCYSILFCGPTGVGKTYLAKLYAEDLVGKNNIIKIDMGEYIDSASINKLIGSPAGYVGYDDNKSLFEEIRNKPYSVLILDEIEKCNPNILNLFLNILDEGKCTLSNGNIIRFDNVVIIMTSNASINKNSLGFNENIENNLLEYFSKEFINRIDDVIQLNNFDEKIIKNIIKKEIVKYSKKYNLTKEKINKIEKESLIESKYQEYGARKLCKIIRNKIEDDFLCIIT